MAARPADFQRLKTGISENSQESNAYSSWDHRGPRSTQQESTWHRGVSCSLFLSSSCRWCQNHRWQWCHRSRLGTASRSFGFLSPTGCKSPPVKTAIEIYNKEILAHLHSSILAHLHSSTLLYLLVASKYSHHNLQQREIGSIAHRHSIVRHCLDSIGGQ